MTTTMMMIMMIILIIIIIIIIIIIVRTVGSNTFNGADKKCIVLVRWVRTLNCEDGGSRFARNVGIPPAKLHGIHAEYHSMNCVR